MPQKHNAKLFTASHPDSKHYLPFCCFCFRSVLDLKESVVTNNIACKFLSAQVFVPLTRLCRDTCGYCTFALPPTPGDYVDMEGKTIASVWLSINSACSSAACAWCGPGRLKRRLINIE